LIGLNNLDMEFDIYNVGNRVIGHEKGIFTVRDETRAMA